MHGPIHHRTADILLVEDNYGDVRLTQEALREAGIETMLHIVNDGVDAMEFLNQKGRFNHAPRPDLILLDLNLPKKSGREVLADIKNDPHLRQIPTVVLSTSASDDDIEEAYNLHVNCYITKPMDIENFIDAVRSLNHFWLQVATLPQAK